MGLRSASRLPITLVEFVWLPDQEGVAGAVWLPDQEGVAGVIWVPDQGDEAAGVWLTNQEGEAGDVWLPDSTYFVILGTFFSRTVC